MSSLKHNRYVGLKIRRKFCARDEHVRVSLRVEKSSPTVYKEVREIATFKGCVCVGGGGGNITGEKRPGK